jgi:hypothetical protein
MKKALLILATITLMLPPAVLLAQQSPTPEVKKTAKADEAKSNTGHRQHHEGLVDHDQDQDGAHHGRPHEGAAHLGRDARAVIMLRGKVSSAEGKRPRPKRSRVGSRAPRA